MRNPLRRSCPLEVLAGLRGLEPLARSRGAVQTLSDMALYAAVGRDRRKLTMEWVENARRRMEEANEMSDRLGF